MLSVHKIRGGVERKGDEEQRGHEGLGRGGHARLCQRGKT